MNRRRFLGTVLTAPAVPLINGADVATRTRPDETTVQAGGFVAYVPRSMSQEEKIGVAEAFRYVAKHPDAVMVLPDDVRVERLR